jgi:hypothetical protein
MAMIVPTGTSISELSAFCTAASEMPELAWSDPALSVPVTSSPPATVAEWDAFTSFRADPLGQPVYMM